MKTKTYTNTDLAQRAHYRLIAYYGLGASQLLWLAEGVELVVHVRPGTLARFRQINVQH